MKTDRILESITFEWNSLVKDLIRNLWVIILAALIALMGTHIVEYSMYTPTYTSEAVLVVHSKTGTSGAYSNLSASSEMANIFTRVFTEPSLKKLAAEHLGLDSFDGTINTSVNSTTNLMNVSVQSKDPELSFKLLSSVLEVYPNVSEFVFTDAVIEVLYAPQMPTSPSNSVLTTHRPYFVLGAMLLAAGLVVVLSLFRETVKEEKGFSDKIDAKLLGTISHEKDHLSPKEKFNKKKRAMLVNDAYASIKFTEDYQKLANKLENSKKKKNRKVFTVTSVAENEGKSTVATNIALLLSDRGYHVALLDLDVRKPSMYKIFGYDKEMKYEFTDVLLRKVSLVDFNFFHYKNGNLIVAFNKKSYTDTSGLIGTNALEECISELCEEADFVIIDTSPLSVSADAVAIAGFSDSTLLVIRTDGVLVHNINDQILNLTDAGCNLEGCILNDVYKPFTLFGNMGYVGTEDFESQQKNYMRYDRKTQKTKNAVREGTSTEGQSSK